MSKAGEVQIVLTANAASYSVAITRAKLQLDQLMGTGKNTGKALAEAARSTVAPWQASSAALRVLEGNMTNNIRAAERFLATIPGVGKALQAAFPVIGAIALLGVVHKLGKELYDLVETANKAAQAQKTFGVELAASQRLEYDRLVATDTELKNQLALLKGKPVDNLTPVINAEQEAIDKLVESLLKANQQVKELTTNNQISALQEMLTGKGATADMAGTIQYWQREISNLAGALSDANQRFGPRSPITQRAHAALDQRRADAENAMQMQMYARSSDVTPAVLATRVKLGMTSVPSGEQSGNLTMAKTYLSILQGQDRTQTAVAAVAKDQAAVTAARQAKQSQSAINKILEQTRRDSEALVAMHRESEEQMAEYARTPGMIAPRALFGLNGRQGGTPDAVPMQSEGLAQNHDSVEFIQQQSKATVDYLKSLNDGVEIQRRNALALAESSLKMEEATGRMSKLDAAQVLAAMHAQAYTEEMNRLREALAAIAANTGLSKVEQLAQSGAVRNQMATLQGGYDVKSAQDDALQQSTSALGAFRDGLNLEVQKLTDMSHAIDLFDRALGDFNKQVVDFLTMKHPRTDFGSVGANLARGVTQMGVQHLEGTVMKMLGFGGGKKRQESNVWVQNWPGGSAGAGGGSSSASGPGGIIGKVLRFLGGGAGGGPASVMAGTADPLGLVAPAAIDTSGLASLLPMFPMMAGGGPISSNMPAIVGERGPELFLPASSGRIVPNHELGGGAGGDMHLHIDARGANDPAATEAAVHRAMKQYVPKITAMSMAAQRDYNSRRPGTSRL